MLTNTVIVFLRDFLPIVILLSYLAVLTRQPIIAAGVWQQWFLPGFGLATITIFFIQSIAAAFAGAGLEVFNAAMLIVAYGGLALGAAICLYSATRSALANTLLLLGSAALVASKLIELFIFFGVYLQHAEALQTVLMGIVVGLGICFSFAIIFHFLINELYQSSFSAIVLLLWTAFIAGQLAQVTGLLAQVDLVSLGAPVVNLNHWVADSSEYGHVLNTLIGYEASPSLHFLLVYLLAMFSPLAFYYLRITSGNRQGRSNRHA
ncbi:hypothetical protein [Alteromonas flava]|uniref:hypothetical protein n=1 Tax=Alteromonas flava TaxID=2048003 RepID=UPI000C284F20|nr:hypothetical protein [Alteromonas flava]